MAKGATKLPSWAAGGGGATGGGGGDTSLPSWAAQPSTANLPSWALPHKRGLLDKIARDTGAEFVGHLGRDIGETAIGVVPGLYHLGHAVVNPVVQDVKHGPSSRQAKQARAELDNIGKGLGTSYRDYYSHNVLSHLYNHPLQPILDALTVADLGATAGVKAGALSGERAAIVTRSPRAIAEGEGPTHVELTSEKPLVRARELLAHKVRTRTATGELGGRVAGEVKAFGKGVHAEANQHALGRLAAYLPYLKATKRLTDNERTALQIRSLDIHPDDLAEVWKNTPDAKLLTPRVRELILDPSKRMLKAEPEARALSQAGEQLGLEHGFLAEHTLAVAKPPPGLLRLRARAARLEKLHGRALTKAETEADKLVAKDPELARIGKIAVGPGAERVIKSYRATPAKEVAITKESAEARLAELEKKHADFEEQARSMLFGDKLSPADMAEQRFRNQSTGRAIRQQSSKANKSFHGTYKSKKYKTVKQEQHAEAVRHILEQVEKNPDAPFAKAYLAETAEMDALKEALTPLPGDPVDLEKAAAAMGGKVKPKSVRELVASRKVRGGGRVIAGKGSARVERLGGALSVARDELQRAEARFSATAPADRVGGTVQRVELPKRAASEVLGRPVRELHGNPYYIPHVVEQEVGVNPLGGRGGGKAEPRRLSSTKRNEGTLFLRGKLSLRPDVLGPEFLRRVKFVKYQEIHKALVDGSIKTTVHELETHYDGKLPKGYEYIRPSASDRIPPALRGESDIPLNLKELIPDAEDLHNSRLAEEGFTTTDIEQALRGPKGELYIAPKQLVKAATGEFTRISDFQRAFIQRPLAVWRAIVLGLRVGFLTNNFVGNSIMYAVRTAGQGALRDLFKSILEQHGANVAKKVLDNAATPPALRQSLYEEFFPEQVAGTFGRTQSPATSSLGAAATKAGRAARDVTSFIPNVTSQVAEVGFRRALIRNYIRRSPEFKAAWKALPEDTRTFETAARKVLTGAGGKPYQRLISKRVNQSLGNYLNLSPVERNVLRNTLPFYAWYKAIVVTTAHLAVDTPLRANILGQIGQIGKQWSDDQLGKIPSFLEGAIPLGNGPHGTKRALGTQGLNPYATLEQLRKGSGSDISNLGINPFFAGILDSYAQARQKSFNVSGGAVLGQTIVNIAKNLPLSQLVEPNPPSKLYPTRGRRTTTLSFLGAPIKEYDPYVAAQEAAQGR